MTREEAITALDDRNILLWGMSWEEQKYYSKALDMAISALKKNKGEDRPKGHWIYPSYPNNYPYMWKSICSNCNTGFPTINKDYKYCPNCGADMRGET